MKLKLFSLLLILTSNVTFAGNYFSTPEQEEVRIKIASKDVLKLRADMKLLKDDILEKSKFIELFADKEMTEQEFHANLTAMSNNIWDEISKGVQEERGIIIYSFLYLPICQVFKEEMAKVKPSILEILLKEDHPKIYEKLL